MHRNTTRTQKNISSRMGKHAKITSKQFNFVMRNINFTFKNMYTNKHKTQTENSYITVILIFHLNNTRCKNTCGYAELEVRRLNQRKITTQTYTYTHRKHNSYQLTTKLREHQVSVCQ